MVWVKAKLNRVDNARVESFQDQQDLNKPNAVAELIRKGLDKHEQEMEQELYEQDRLGEGDSNAN